MKTLNPVLESDDYDININVYDLENGKYLIRDSKENIQFQCSNKLCAFDFCNDETFFDDLFYQKLNSQNYMELDEDRYNDSYYCACLFNQLERIIDHCKGSYVEFQDDYQIPKEYILPIRQVNQNLKNDDNSTCDIDSNPF